MYILAIDTSCDDTSASVVKNDLILSNIISSQIPIHEKWGGVVPHIAKRKHQEFIDKIINKALKVAKIKMTEIDYIAVTYGPGLAIALEVGIQKAKDLAILYNKPLIPVNHLEGHIYSAFAKNSKGKPINTIKFPLLALLVSGGHTEIILMKNHGDYTVLGKTLDDAIGESFDKVARALNFGYPGGPIIEKIAREGDENAFSLPIPMINSNNLNMSYSGLKTETIYLISSMINVNTKYKKINENIKNKFKLKYHYDHKKDIITDIAASFQKAAIEQLLTKVKYAIDLLKKDQINIKNIIVAGGVSRNLYLKKKIRKTFKNIKFYFPTNNKLYTDNAGMIGVAGYFNVLNNRFLKTKNEILKLDRKPKLKLNEGY